MQRYSETKILGVIGNPVSHSLSPVFQNYLIKKHRLNWVYIPFCVDTKRFDFFWEGIKSIENILGFNITIPFKELVLNHCDVISYEAKKIGAVNTVFFKGSRIYGFNTDVYGIISSIKYKLKTETLSGKKIMLIGAGGAAKAAVYALYTMGVNKLIIVNRSMDRAEALKEHAEKNFGIQVILKTFQELDKAIYSEKPYLIINSTSIGLKGESFDINFQKLWKECKIFDMVYSKNGTKLIINALNSGLKAVDGLSMLVYQGLKSFTIWSGIDDVDASYVINFLSKKVRYGKNLNYR